MKRTVVTIFFAAVLAAVVVPLAMTQAGCFGTETGNPPFAPEVGWGGYEPMGIAPDPTLESGTVRVESASLIECGDERRVVFLRAVVFDFVHGTATAGEALEVAEGTYCGVVLEIAPCADPERCRLIAPDAITITGTRRSDGAAIAIHDVSTVEVVLDGTFDVAPTEGALLFAIDRDALTAGLSISTLALEADGVGRIDGDHNTDRLVALHDGLRTATTLRRDLDGDAMLDTPDEITGDPLARAR
jgi:hypothetical protein